MSFRFHLSVSFRSKPNSKRISTPSLVLHTYIYIFSCGSRKRMKILFRRYYRYFSSLSFFFLRKSLKFSLLRFYNKLVHHELLFSSNSNLVTVLIVHEMLRCKSVESFRRSQYTTFLLLIVEIAFDNQSREKIFVITITRPLFSNDVISQKFVSRMFQMLVIIWDAGFFSFWLMQRR